MSGAQSSEDDWVVRLRARLAPFEKGVRVGIGDDAAWLEADSRGYVAALDVLVDGVHVHVAEVGAAAMAYKGVAVNLSDLAAMGAEPHAVLVGLVVPPQDAAQQLEAVLDGLVEACVRFGVSVVGGDTNVSRGPLVVSITVLGKPGPRGLVLRSGARVGDRLSVTGPLGGSLRGRHLRPEPRLAAGRAFAESGFAHAMMDLSDGLGRDLPRLLTASGVGAVVEASHVPIHDDVQGERTRHRAGEPLSPALLQALGDGEDFELLLAHAPATEAERAGWAQQGIVLYDVGEVVAAKQGLSLSRGGRLEPWPQSGYDHLARAAGRS